MEGGSRKWGWFKKMGGNVSLGRVMEIMEEINGIANRREGELVEVVVKESAEQVQNIDNEETRGRKKGGKRSNEQRKNA